MSQIVREKQNLTHLKWAHAKEAGGIGGTFLKSEASYDASDKKIYYKLSNYDREVGVIGHECVYEIIVDRLLNILEVEHLEYSLIYADVNINGRVSETWLCATEDFKNKWESKAALDDFYFAQKEDGESPYDFCKRMGWQKSIDQMLVIDYLILNRDRHGANIEVLRNKKDRSIKIAPLFDHGVAFLYSCLSEEAIRQFDVLGDKPCQSFIGSRSTLSNLDLIDNKKGLFANKLSLKDKEYLFEDLDDIISEVHKEKIWDMLWKRWCNYENICNL